MSSWNCVWQNENSSFCNFFLSNLLFLISFPNLLPRQQMFPKTIPSRITCNHIYGVRSWLPESYSILVHTFMMPLVYQFLVGYEYIEVWWSILFDMVILIQRPLSLCIIQAPSQSIVDDVVQNNNKNVVTCNRNRCGNLERHRVSPNTPECERNNKQLRRERAWEGVYGIYHRRERLRNANYSTHWAE